MINKIGTIIIIILFSFQLKGEMPLIDSSKNVIINRESLSHFYKKLDDAEVNNSTVSILHIGDSHIQAGFLTGTLREDFQAKYGNAGRGLVFPYRLAQTNGHMDVKFSSNVKWNRYRIITDDAPKVGISGATIYTDAEEFIVKMKCPENERTGQLEINGKGLEQVKIMVLKEGAHLEPIVNTQRYRVKSGDVLGKIARKFKVTIRNLKKQNKLKGSMIRIGQVLSIPRQRKLPNIDSTQFEVLNIIQHTDTKIAVTLPVNTKEVYLVKQKSTKNNPVSLYSLQLQQDFSGVVYNSTGFNGAKFIDYLNSPLFFIQLEQLYRPDLVIVSLGTNEAFDKIYSSDSFKQDVELFCKEIEHRTGCTNILLTTPPSALKNRKYPNKQLDKYSKILKSIAETHNYAVWDLYGIMGGAEGMKEWYKSGLAGKDRIHFKEKGYKLQGDLLYEALIGDCN